MKRRTLDLLFSMGGVGLAALLLIIGVVMWINADFSNKYVADQLQLADLTSIRETVFEGETLRGVLLTSYGFSELGNKAEQAATVIYLGVILLTLPSIAGFLHALVTSRSKAFTAPEPMVAKTGEKVTV